MGITDKVHLGWALGYNEVGHLGIMESRDTVG